MTSPPKLPTFRADNTFASIKAIAIVGRSNTGKTELICRLIPRLAAHGLRVAVLKHSHHPDLDPRDQGKDTWRYRQAGAQTVALAAPGLLHVTRSFSGEPPLEQVLSSLAAAADLVLVEGYKTGPLPKVAVLAPDDRPEPPKYPHLIALVSERSVDSPLPVFQPHQVEELGHWLYDYLSRA
ncbi:MAG: molybdopterin-guanine dinucleotide biosynthesis protein B [Syntrophobacterales bacterium]|jgi:molybdopterin-guanine dinucleotide biosynthesis protein MobB